jgi:hypothetical protein
MGWYNVLMSSLSDTSFSNVQAVLSTQFQICSSCTHDYVLDWIDLDPERSQQICYCRWCEHCPTPAEFKQWMVQSSNPSSACASD